MYSSLTPLEPQSRFGDKPLKFQAVCPPHGTAVLEGLTRSGLLGQQSRFGDKLRKKCWFVLQTGLRPQKDLVNEDPEQNEVHLRSDEVESLELLLVEARFPKLSRNLYQPMPEEQDDEQEPVGVGQCHHETADAARAGLPATSTRNSKRGQQQQQEEQAGMALIGGTRQIENIS